MTKLGYKANCLCGGEITCVFKKPTQMQHSVARSKCDKCESEFMFSCHVGLNEKGRYYFTDHTVTNMTDLLKEKVKMKREELKKEGAA